MPAPLVFELDDPARDEKERDVRAMSDDDLLALYNATRAAAHLARTNADLETLYPLARGMKTIQRIAGERGLIIRARRLGPKPSNI
jgi:hypothetical protein